VPLSVLAVGLFVAFWVIVAVGLFVIAARGGLSGTPRPERRGGRGSNRVVGIGFVFVAIVFGIALPATMLIGNHQNASAQVGGLTLTANEKAGRELFGQHCGVCHTLAAANAVGKVGPNLDVLRPTLAITLHTINNGCLPNATAGSPLACLGEGVMPAGVVQGRDAQDVAEFVARVAGME
jgi:mono/diheme cytochrome c family protein